VNHFVPTGSGRGEDKVYDVEVSCVPGSKKTAARDVASSPACWRPCEGDEEEDLLLLLEMVPGPRPRRATLGMVVGPTRSTSSPLFFYFCLFFCFLFLDSNLILKSVVQEFGFMT
jgi:hypothetical protein